METKLGAEHVKFISYLETFLGGMETAVQVLEPVRDLPLKPSLVEWKRLCQTRFQSLQRLLETFLGGMETLRRPEPNLRELRP